jgi:hypothetical protein
MRRRRNHHKAEARYPAKLRLSAKFLRKPLGFFIGGV